MRIINQQKWLKPMEIAKQGLIQNTTGHGTTKGNYHYIIGLIKSGRLRAKNVGRGQTPYYLVPEDEIKRYHDTITRVSR